MNVYKMYWWPYISWTLSKTKLLLYLAFIFIILISFSSHEHVTLAHPWWLIFSKCCAVYPQSSDKGSSAWFGTCTREANRKTCLAPEDPSTSGTAGYGHPTQQTQLKGKAVWALVWYSHEAKLLLRTAVLWTVQTQKKKKKKTTPKKEQP